MRRKQQRGTALVEFSLAGIAMIFLIICTFHLAMGMWNYHTLATTVHEATRYAAVKGVNCSKPGNSCRITVGTLATRIKTYGIGVPSSSVSVTLRTDSGAETLCNPLNS